MKEYDTDSEKGRAKIEEEYNRMFNYKPAYEIKEVPLFQNPGFYIFIIGVLVSLVSIIYFLARTA